VKSFLQTSKSIPAWQIERERKLHRACLSVQAAIQRGEQKLRFIRRVARRYNNRNFKSDPARRMALTAGTLLRLFRVWQKNGEVPSAFRLNYAKRSPAITAPVLIRFIDFSARQQFLSMKSAWEKFSARGGNFGCGRRSNKPVKLSYEMARYYFPAAKFHKLQEQLGNIDQAQNTLACLRLDFQAEIIALLPERAPRRRVKKEADFQI
jgi:hypothetical protein